MMKPLTTGANLVLCLAWLLIAVLCLASLPASAAIYLLPTLFLGAAAGVLQARAQARAANEPRARQSIIGVRRVLLGSTDGKASTWLLMLTAITLIGWLWPLGGEHWALILLCAYAMFAFAREWFALPRTYRPG